MQNNEIFEKLVSRVGSSYAITITEIVSTLYDIAYNAAKSEDACIEYDYERQWWMDKFKELIR
jgi:predicted nuclease with TOPRIM domain